MLRSAAITACVVALLGCAQSSGPGAQVPHESDDDKLTDALASLSGGDGTSPYAVDRRRRLCYFTLRYRPVPVDCCKLPEYEDARTQLWWCGQNRGLNVFGM
jgi:hypothetical protein